MNHKIEGSFWKGVKGAPRSISSILFWNMPNNKNKIAIPLEEIDEDECFSPCGGKRIKRIEDIACQKSFKRASYHWGLKKPKIEKVEEIIPTPVEVVVTHFIATAILTAKKGKEYVLYVSPEGAAVFI